MMIQIIQNSYVVYIKNLVSERCAYLDVTSGDMISLFEISGFIKNGRWRLLSVHSHAGHVRYYFCLIRVLTCISTGKLKQRI